LKLFERLAFSSAEGRRFDEWLFEVALDQMARGQLRRGLWGKALAEADGSVDRAKGIYLKLHVQAIKDDATIMDALTREFARRARAGQTDPLPESVGAAPDREHLRGAFRVWLARQDLSPETLGTTTTEDYFQAFLHRLDAGELDLGDLMR
jgi:hypothetical protein